jgi:carbamoyltransferase
MRRICGLKLTHDGAIAIVGGNKLEVCVEAEKVGNSRRYQDVTDTAFIVAQLDRHACSNLQEIAFVIDGWQPTQGIASLPLSDAGAEQRINVAPYTAREPFAAAQGRMRLAGEEVEYISYAHATGHAMAAYATSPYAVTSKDSLVLVWDGGMPAILYLYEPRVVRLSEIGVVLPLSGHIYPSLARHLAPFCPPDRHRGDESRSAEADGGLASHLEISGKAMAFAGLGSKAEEAEAIFRRETTRCNATTYAGALLWSRRSFREAKRLGLADADIMASFQAYLEHALTDGLERCLKGAGIERGTLPLCFAGGCALNLGLNSTLRESNLVQDVWVPPFPNDAGSAIGTACVAMSVRHQGTALEWDVFSGPQLVEPMQEIPAEWTQSDQSPEELGEFIARSGEIVAVLHGRAELGPRALGHRSLLAPATAPHMQMLLNKLKDRESFRPVAPICLEHEAPHIFDPGTPDPYMIFRHRVRAEWRARIPAIVHVDGTARLQTVNSRENRTLFRILSAYQSQSGIPVLCNTSANQKGHGFFPDVLSAITWGGVARIWSDGILYSKSS